MTTYVALLRGVNVGGKSVAMADLRACVARSGFDNARTLLQSGNLVLHSRTRPTAAFEQLLQTDVRKHLALETEFFVRTADEWRAVVERNPFHEAARRDPSHLIMMALKETPDAGAMTVLTAAITGRETVRADGRHLYAIYPDGMGRSRLTHALIERTLRTRATARNWNTVLKIDALAGGAP